MDQELAPTRHIRSMDDVLRMLDGLFAQGADRWADEGSAWWDTFYQDRSRSVPFFVAKPDENLVTHLDRGAITGTRALDLGCGPGRNALELASRGWDVTAIDLSSEAIAWARERADASGASVRFVHGDAFAQTDEVLGDAFDLVYDSGCFHHLPPHRRVSYLALLDRALTPGGHFAMTCFAAGRMGSEVPDADLYRRLHLGGGLAYTDQSLRSIFSPLAVVESRAMRDEGPGSALFGEPFLWTVLFRRGTP
ncbi:class I SAM-dependent methyltransferase [Streptomyces sp. 549]|uniref:class I SAM-dependent methyltransferase n=1 Tax=Streptomyces sp. 549 TaxID=3049076 RepID=UPI0024C2B309|nr:class I SAM-dependent methyltransferase [Streptomyces sp. 549]MDK1475854.1 class I SAM-dependent methyltransferase [Streptomyces sp. 549]